MATSSMSDMDSSSLYNSSEYGGEEGSEADALVPPPSSWFESSNDTSDALTSMDTNDNTVERESQEDGSSTEEINNIVAGMKVPLNPTNYTATSSVGRVHPSPSWREISSQVLPAAARELLSSSLRQIYYTARLSYSKGRWRRKHSDMGNKSGGFSHWLHPILNCLPIFQTSLRFPVFHGLTDNWSKNGEPTFLKHQMK